jgi:hypothetical protein
MRESGKFLEKVMLASNSCTDVVFSGIGDVLMRATIIE